MVQPNIRTQPFSPPISAMVEGAVDSSPSSVKDSRVGHLHIQAPMAQQFLNRSDVIAIHAEAQVRFDPPNQDIIVDQLTGPAPVR
jgi:hypothetical protein